MLWNVKSHRNKVAFVKYKFTLWDRTHTGRYEVTIINNKVSIRNTVKIVRYKLTLEDKSHNNDRQIHNWKILNHKFLHKFAIPRNKVDIANYCSHLHIRNHNYKNKFTVVRKSGCDKIAIPKKFLKSCKNAATLWDKKHTERYEVTITINKVPVVRYIATFFKLWGRKGRRNMCTG